MNHEELIKLPCTSLTRHIHEIVVAMQGGVVYNESNGEGLIAIVEWKEWHEHKLEWITFQKFFSPTDHNLTLFWKDETYYDSKKEYQWSPVIIGVVSQGWVDGSYFDGDSRTVSVDRPQTKQPISLYIPKRG